MLTKRQADTLQAIRDFQVDHGVSPTLRELAEMLQVSNQSTVHRHMTFLKQKGYIEWEPTKTRTIRVLVTERMR